MVRLLCSAGKLVCHIIIFMYTALVYVLQGQANSSKWGESDTMSCINKGLDLDQEITQTAGTMGVETRPD